jgi:hypothetical protein
MRREMDRDVTISFYMPLQDSNVSEIPQGTDDYWDWILRHGIINEGKYSWTLQTYLHLKKTGVQCELVRQFPRNGIVISHRDFLPVSLIPRPNVFLVCIKPDRKEHTWAHYYIVQNRNDPVLDRIGSDRAKEIPFWPQPSLVQRRRERGDLCENVAYFGRLINLADELKSEEWKNKLYKLGFHWSLIPLKRWNDYSNVDLTVSIRGFSDRSDLVTGDPILDSDSKPPSKLINSWLAGVPAIVGIESAYRNIRESHLDYIEAATIEELVEALQAIRRNKLLYRAMVDHGLKRARDFSTDAIFRKWQDVIKTEIIKRHEKWIKVNFLMKNAVNMLNIATYFTRRKNLVDIVSAALREINHRRAMDRG